MRCCGSHAILPPTKLISVLTKKNQTPAAPGGNKDRNCPLVSASRQPSYSYQRCLGLMPSHNSTLSLCRSYYVTATAQLPGVAPINSHDLINPCIRTCNQIKDVFHKTCDDVPGGDEVQSLFAEVGKEAREYNKKMQQISRPSISASFFLCLCLFDLTPLPRDHRASA